MFMTFEYLFFFDFFHNSVNIHYFRIFAERMNVRKISGEVRVLGVGLRTKFMTYRNKDEHDKLTNCDEMLKISGNLDFVSSEDITVFVSHRQGNPVNPQTPLRVTLFSCDYLQCRHFFIFILLFQEKHFFVAFKFALGTPQRREEKREQG